MIDYLMMSYNYEMVEFEPLKLGDITKGCDPADKETPIVFKVIGRIDNHIQKQIQSYNLNNS
jgi:hypothetical protein